MFQQKNTGYTTRYTLRPLPDAQSQFEQAKALHQQGQLEQARLLYEGVLRQQAHHVDTLHLLGVLHFQQGNAAQAATLIQQSIQLQATNPGSHMNLGNALLSLKQWDASLASYIRALELKPDYVNAYVGKGAVLGHLGRLQEAVVSLDCATALDPQHAEAYYNRGDIFKELGQFNEAVASYDRAIALRPSFAEAYLNRGDAYLQLCQLAPAITSFNQAIAVRSEFALAYWAKAVALLLSGDFTKGWPLHEWRWRIGDDAREQRNFAQPLWLGKESLKGKTILLHGEQGLGDSIQFCRYAKQVAALGGRVILEVPHAIKGILGSVEGVSALFGRGEALPAFDYHCPLLSLPLAFGTQLDTIPIAQAYVHANAQRVAQWSATLGEKTSMRVGLVWSGNASHGNDRNRSMALATLLQGLPEGLQYFSLQKEVRPADQEALLQARHIRHLGAELHDFADTAAVCSLMDVVISVDTSVAHLSAAMGKPTWLMLPFVPDWRWLLDRSDSPWYPSVRLYRQDGAGQWGAVLQRLHHDLLGGTY
jgi:tetratricopeptide (TPR) repeat protein